MLRIEPSPRSRRPTFGAVEALRRGLADESAHVRIAVEDFDLKRDPEVVPTVIHKMALRRAETKREGVDALGNVSNLVEALGNVGAPDAVNALVAALDSKSLPLRTDATSRSSIATSRAARAIPT